MLGWKRQADGRLGIHEIHEMDGLRNTQTPCAERSLRWKQGELEAEEKSV